ncbi:MAG: AAA family ATPase [Chloroflexi bacterium]|nr:AAA family ATPase [Chloroflexota bacterium]
MRSERKSARLPEIAEALLDPRAYPEKPERIEMVQTQMSFVFLTGDYVYKVKKPVNLGYLDYTTLEKRRYFCQREVELNQRLCPETYLGVVPLTRRRKKIVLGGRSEAVDYAVKMRQLPRDRMLDVLLGKEQVIPEMISQVAQKVVEFHRKAETSAVIRTFGNIFTIRTNTDENFRQTEKYTGVTISQSKYERIKYYTGQFLKSEDFLLEQRVAGDRIRDCHGDLHAAHVCFSDGICIYDCIEFSDRFRYGDVASEVAFLAMDLDHHGRADLSRAFVNTYVDSSGDKELIGVLNFYKCYRAYVRGKVESFKLDDPYISDTEKQDVREAAASYFDLAGFYTRAKPVLFITVGLMGTGKTALARALAKRTGTVVISSDVTRKQLASVPLTEHRFEQLNAGIYSQDFTRRTYDTMFAAAGRILAEGGSVILDASFIKSEERLKARELARETGADFFVLECKLGEEQVKQRLTQRLEEGTVSDGRWEIYGPQKKSFEPVVEVSAQNYVIIDTSKPVQDIVRQVMEKIGEG